MIGGLASFILDASVGIKILVEEEDSCIIEKLIKQAYDNENSMIFVPDLFYVECANIIWKKVTRKLIRNEDALSLIDNLNTQNFICVSNKDLITKTCQIALKYNISAYDACYAALAELKNLPLITADIRLKNALRNHTIQIISLDEIGN